MVFAAGPLQPALLASAALPGIFPPIRHDRRVLVDGVPLNAAVGGAASLGGISLDTVDRIEISRGNLAALYEYMTRRLTEGNLRNDQRALDEVADLDPAAQAKMLRFLEGIELTERELMSVFQRHNIRRLETVGAKFDPNFHQALFEVPTKEHPPGTVVQEMQSGFAIGERCLRPAMVGVAKAEG